MSEQLSHIQIETTPAIPAEKRTSIPDGWPPTVTDPIAAHAQLHAQLRAQIAGLAIALRQIAWLADAEQPLSVKAAQIASDALEELGNY